MNPFNIPTDPNTDPADPNKPPADPNTDPTNKPPADPNTDPTNKPPADPNKPPADPANPNNPPTIDLKFMEQLYALASLHVANPTVTPNTTIAELQKQLDSKEKELQAARQDIQVMKEKVLEVQATAERDAQIASARNIVSSERVRDLEDQVVEKVAGNLALQAMLETQKAENGKLKTEMAEMRESYRKSIDETTNLLRGFERTHTILPPPPTNRNILESSSAMQPLPGSAAPPPNLLGSSVMQPLPGSAAPPPNLLGSSVMQPLPGSVAPARGSRPLIGMATYSTNMQSSPAMSTPPSANSMHMNPIFDMYLGSTMIDSSPTGPGSHYPYTSKRGGSDLTGAHKRSRSGEMDFEARTNSMLTVMVHEKTGDANRGKESGRAVRKDKRERKPPPKPAPIKGRSKTKQVYGRVSDEGDSEEEENDK